jgi:hypothetical protein
LDINNGGDTNRWQNLAINTYAPALLREQESNSVHIGTTIDPNDEVLLSFPAYFDDDPLPQSQYFVKTKFRGKTREGIIAVTDKYLAFSFGMDHGCVTHRWDLDNIKELNSLSFKFSKLSITAGPGCEVLTSDRDKPERLVFRISLLPDDLLFIESLRKLLKLES